MEIYPELWHGLMTVASALVIGLIIMLAKWTLHVRDAVNDIDDAVNHRHLKPLDSHGNPPAKLYDLALETKANLDDHVLEEEQDMKRILRRVQAAIDKNHLEHLELNKRIDNL